MSAVLIATATWCAASAASALVLGAAAEEIKARVLADRQRAAGRPVRVRRAAAVQDLRRAIAWVCTALRRAVHGGVAGRVPLLLAAAVIGAMLGLLVTLESSWPSDFLGVAR